MTEHHEESRRLKERRHFRSKPNGTRKARDGDDDGGRGRPRLRDDEDDHFDWRRLSLDDDSEE